MMNCLKVCYNMLVLFGLVISVTRDEVIAVSENQTDHGASANKEFTCKGRASGYYADIKSGCQVYHMCDDIGRQFSYSCPNTTRFQQRMLICDHWYMVNCSRAEKDYTANLLIGQRDKPFVSEAEEHLRTPLPNLLDQPYEFNGTPMDPVEHFRTKKNNIDGISSDKKNPTVYDTTASMQNFLPSLELKVNSFSATNPYISNKNILDVKQATSQPSRLFEPPHLNPIFPYFSETLLNYSNAKSTIKNTHVENILNNPMSNSNLSTHNSHIDETALPSKTNSRKTTSKFQYDSIKSNILNIEQPVMELLPPLKNPSLEYQETSTSGPIIYYEWKWALPAFDMELPNLNSCTTCTTNNPAQQTSSVRPKNNFAHNPFLTSYLKKPSNRLVKSLAEKSEDYQKQYQSITTTETSKFSDFKTKPFVPEYDFPLEQNAREGYSRSDALTSFLVKVYHMCDDIGRQFSYSCPNTTRFQQRMLICDHWYMVNCSRAEKDYTANLLIGQRDKPFVSEAEEHLRTPLPNLLDQPYEFNGTPMDPVEHFRTKKNNIDGISSDKKNPTVYDTTASMQNFLPSLELKVNSFSATNPYISNKNILDVKQATSQPSRLFEPPHLNPIFPYFSETLLNYSNAKSTIKNTHVENILNNPMSNSNLSTHNSHIDETALPSKTNSRKTTSKFQYDSIKSNILNIEQPVMELLPPLKNPSLEYQETSTSGPIIYYEWKWALPAFDMELPNLNSCTTCTTNNPAQQTSSVRPKNNFAHNPFLTSYLKKPSNRLVKSLAEKSEDYQKQYQSITTTETSKFIDFKTKLFVPEYDFPLEQNAREGYSRADALTSFLVKVNSSKR